MLGTVIFSNETASGWQEAAFATPVPVEAGVTYVASYHAPNGGYARDLGYFGSGYQAYPLAAPALLNGVYGYGPSGTFPANTFSATNYWVDLVFVTEP
jgi:hypothetical protein